MKGKYVSLGQQFEIVGDAVIITVPLNILSQIRFVPTNDKTKPAERLTEIYKLLEDIWHGPATKIMLQHKERFCKKESIHGGSSITSMPVKQLYYLTINSDTKINWGILMCYIRKSEALMFVALKLDDAICEAVKQIAKIH